MLTIHGLRLDTDFVIAVAGDTLFETGNGAIGSLGLIGSDHVIQRDSAETVRLPVHLIDLGLLANGLTVQCFLLRPRPVGVVPFGWQAVLIVASGTCASTLAAGGAYLHLRMVTRRDPDYEEPAGPVTGR